MKHAVNNAAKIAVADGNLPQTFTPRATAALKVIRDEINPQIKHYPPEPLMGRESVNELGYATEKKVRQLQLRLLHPSIPIVPGGRFE